MVTETIPTESPGIRWRENSHRALRKHLALSVFDCLCFMGAMYAALSIRLSLFPLNGDWMNLLLKSDGPLLVIALGCQVTCGVYRIACRYTGLRDLAVIALASFLAGILFSGYVRLAHITEFPLSAIFINGLLQFFLIAGSRVAYRLLLEPHSAHLTRSTEHEKRILIIGAGRIGASLARDIRNCAPNGLNLIGFLDDNRKYENYRINGTPVLGNTDDVRRLVLAHSVDTVIVAMGCPPTNLIREITRNCEGLKVRLQVAPGLADLRINNALPRVRDIALEDLLPRKEVIVDRPDILSYLNGKHVLITGAGGSIGSELVRHILVGNPAEIILLGHGENSIFEIEQELRRDHNRIPICVIADIRDYDRLRNLFEKHRPSVVFHAAAHKHVGLMEGNPEEAVTNNVLGTRNLVRIASRTGVKRFAMISSDKAVNPISIMGATKRIAEMVVQIESRKTPMDLVTVRFGNVLGSRGSVVPLMRKQILKGGPVTVTHPEATRYFMTIPEAAQLVIQAGALGGHGAIYMLDMGEPVRIMDLALDLIRLSGFTPHMDIPIEIIGLKPGEKIFEELLTAEEYASKTTHERIYIAKPMPLSADELDEKVDALVHAAQIGDITDVLHNIHSLIPDFAYRRPQTVVADRHSALRPFSQPGCKQHV